MFQAKVEEKINKNIYVQYFFLTAPFTR